jgi:hypothetical protein
VGVVAVRECVDFCLVNRDYQDDCVQIRKFGLAGQLVFHQNKNCAIVTLSAGVLDWLPLISQAGYLREVSGLKSRSRGGFRVRALARLVLGSDFNWPLYG